ncbi:uncharacterized protein LOC106661706 [Cimex lectularius]|uniref:Uncharacterized protein n=1 Tax=Cimex lectularius TaxID=79782 RepID=A0A8I6RCP6_CIMLE|nr:uncharacterized protein LOC106661706 [Cimex lectularius]
MDSKQAIMSLAIATIATFLVLNSHLGQAQVTFSRDWSAGKRGVPECAVPFKSAAAIGQMLLSELRAIANCELRTAYTQKLAQDEDNTQDVFIPQHNG